MPLPLRVTCLITNEIASKVSYAPETKIIAEHGCFGVASLLLQRMEGLHVLHSSTYTETSTGGKTEYSVFPSLEYLVLTP